MIKTTNKIKVSVVINTCNRGIYLGDTLEGLRRQTYDNFEVIVVNGPSIDETEKIAKSYNIRYYEAPFNISVSRNIGIKHAAGDVIAFIDDDAVPEPEWLADIVVAYSDPSVAAAGGRVYDADGVDFQYSYGAIDRWGYPLTRHDASFNYNNPTDNWLNINIGTNASYRREPLVEIGGFDEEIEYYHDESDVCVRLIEAGYRVAQLDNAYVHHKMAPSFRRRNSKKTVVWDAIVKNTIYFGVKHTKGHRPLYKRILRPFWSEKSKLKAPFHLMKSGDFTFVEALVRFFSLCRSFVRGYYRGFFHERQLMQDYKHESKEFLKFKNDIDFTDKPLTIVLVNQGFPPDQTDGTARYNGVLAAELSKKGHNVFVVARSSSGHDSVHFLNGSWVYRHDSSAYNYPTTGFERVDSQLAHARGVLSTVRKINAKKQVDFIFVPIWDVEGISILKHKVAPTILALMSPLKKVVETQWFNVDEPSYDITYALERYCVLQSDAIVPISENIKKTIGDLYDIKWPEIEINKPVEVIPLGVDSRFIVDDKSLDKWYIERKASNEINILYVGRFERRKGIDLILENLPKLLKNNKNVSISLIGDNTGVDENNISYYQVFVDKYSNEDWFGRIEFKGYVTDEELASSYRRCDIFVAPSRYESFGQIYIEAMAAGKPVVGTNVGGIPEIIKNGVNGYLIENENSKELGMYLQKLIDKPELREKMGRESARILRKDYASDVWADKFLEFAKKALSL